MFINSPPLGWNSWNTFADKIDEEVVLGIADTMVESGLKDAGYEYVIIDDCWSCRERDENGDLVPNPEKFPHGIKYVSDYIHAKGLKFGMYSSAGFMTCAGFPGSYGHEWQDAKKFAEWGVDYLKYDYCFHPSTLATDVLYKRMSMALRNCGRDILFATCSWGGENTKQWIRETGAHTWRSTGDIWDSWESMKGIATSQIAYQEYNGHGCFNDMDMLVVGLGGKGYAGVTGMTEDEYKMHFSYWALLNSPLIIGCDIRSMSPETKAILMNKEVIAINQDAYCQPFIVSNTKKWEINEARASNEPFYKNYPTDQVIFAKYLNDGDIAIGIFNFSETGMAGSVYFDLLGMPVESVKQLEITDLWTGEKEISKNGTVNSFKRQEPHTFRLLRVKVID